MLQSAALPAPSRQPQLPPRAVALTTDWISDVDELNKLLGEGVIVLLTPSANPVALHLAPAHLAPAPLPSGQLADPASQDMPDIVRVGQLEIDLGGHRVRWQGSCLDLSEREIAMLACLGQEVGRACSFADLFKRAWGSSCGIDALVIHSAVQRIRRKFAAAGVPVTIESVRGYGFRIAFTSARRGPARA